MKQEFTLDELRTIAAEIRGAIMPKTVTPEMVGGALAGIIRILGGLKKYSVGEIQPEDLNEEVSGQNMGVYHLVSDDGHYLGIAIQGIAGTKLYQLAIGCLIPESDDALTLSEDSEGEVRIFFRVFESGTVARWKDERADLQNKITSAAEKLHQDEWNTLCGSYGKYDPENAPDAEHPYYLNKIWLTYEEALVCKKAYINSPTQTEALHIVKAKTNIPVPTSWSGSYTRFAQDNSNLETAVIGQVYTGQNLLNGFSGCKNLWYCQISTVYFASSNCFEGAFTGCTKLKTLLIRDLNQNLSIKDSPLITSDSLIYIINHRRSSGVAVTITVHTDVYAKLTGNDTSLTEEEREEWTALVPLGLSENISFATV